MDSYQGGPPSVENHRLYLFTIFTFGLILVIVALKVAWERTSGYGRASSTASGSRGQFSRENSYIFASPLTALSDGKSRIRIIVFVLNDRGLGISGEKAALRTSGANLQVQPVQPLTDQFGRAIYDISSETAGSYTINAEIGGSALPRAVEVLFRK